MTEHLSTLLTREADGLDVPPAPSREILDSGRRLRRRRTTTVWAGATLAVAIVVAGSAVVSGRDSGNDTSNVPRSATPPPISTAWAVKDTVYVGADARAVTMPEYAQSLYFTSAGILVRTNKDGSFDGGAPFHFELVTDKATPTKLDVTLGEVIPSTDASEPYLAWATMDHGKIQVVVHDVSTDRDVARVDVPGDFTWAAWEAPPVALSGDLVYVATDHRTTVLDWRTGEARTTEIPPGQTVPEVAAGRTLIATHGPKSHAEVADVATGRTLLDLPTGLGNFPTLSPDGRFVMVSGGFDPPSRTTVYDLDDGTEVKLPPAAGTYAWNGDGSIILITDGTMFTCDAATGSCTPSTVPSVKQPGLIRYAGQLLES